ncbi:MAG: ABC transporter permease, partial [Sandaracinaceae bacterium]|nr:ABC transporter permease [Sandaracinaceae bacterium]
PLGELGPAGPMPKTRPFRVAGIFYSGMYEYDMKLAYTTLDAAQRFLNTGEGISGIEIKVDDVDRAEDRALGIASAIARPELRVRGWQEVNRNLFGALALEKLAMFITLGIAILVASFCIVGTLTLMVQEKGREVGILKAMGARSGQIVAVFMLQGLMIGVLGAMIGLGLGYVACFAAEHFGVIPMNPEVYYIDRLPVHIDPVEFSLVGVASVAIALLATIYPAILGSRLQPVDALRYA